MKECQTGDQHSKGTEMEPMGLKESCESATVMLRPKLQGQSKQGSATSCSDLGNQEAWGLVTQAWALWASPPAPPPQLPCLSVNKFV